MNRFVRRFSLVAALLFSAAGCSSLCVRPSAPAGASPRFSVFGSAVETVAKQRDVSVAEAARLLKEAGVEGFDVAYNHPSLPVLAKTALVPVNLYGFIDYRSPDGGAGANAAFIDTAVRYGVARVMCIPNDFEKGVPSEEAYAVLRKGLADLVAKGAARGVTVMVEDFGGVANACSHQRYLERFLADIPGLCFALDSGNLYWAGRGEDIRDAFRYAAGRISHVHLKDLRKDNRRSYVTLGLGAVPNAEIVKTVHRQGYTGFYTLENPVGDVLEDVVRQVALVRHWTNGSR